jgi:hypothetical protein
MVMIYLKVFSWWNRIKAERRRQQEATAIHMRTGREPSREQVDARIKAERQLSSQALDNIDEAPYYQHQQQHQQQERQYNHSPQRQPQQEHEPEEEEGEKKQQYSPQKQQQHSPYKEQLSPQKQWEQRQQLQQRQKKQQQQQQQRSYSSSSFHAVGFKDDDIDLRHRHSDSAPRPNNNTNSNSNSNNRYHTSDYVGGRLYGDRTNTAPTAAAAAAPSLSSYDAPNLRTPLLDAELGGCGGGGYSGSSSSLSSASLANPDFVCVVTVHGVRDMGNLDRDVASIALHCSDDNGHGAGQYGGGGGGGGGDSTVVKYGAATQWAVTSAIILVPASSSSSSSFANTNNKLGSSGSNSAVQVRLLGSNDEELFSTRLQLPTTLTVPEIVASTSSSSSSPSSGAAAASTSATASKSGGNGVGVSGGGNLIDQVHRCEWVSTDGLGLAQCNVSIVKLRFRDLALVVRELANAKDELAAVDEESETLTQQVSVGRWGWVGE